MVVGGQRSNKDKKLTLFRRHRLSFILIHVETLAKTNTLFWSDPRVTPGSLRNPSKLEAYSRISNLKKEKKLITFDNMNINKGRYMAELYADYGTYSAHAFKLTIGWVSGILLLTLSRHQHRGR